MPVDTTFKALDLIFKLAPGLKSLTGERRNTYFDRVVQPLFNAVCGVHDGYTALFLEFRRELVGVLCKMTSLLETERTLTAQELEQVTAIKESFLEKRTRDESLRDVLRNEAQFIFQNIKWPEERRFAASVMYYFLGRGGIAPDDATLDCDIKEVIRSGGISAWATPSTALYIQIRESTDLQGIIDQVDEARNDLNQKYMNVRLLYQKVQHHLIMKT